ncbi:MAG: DUF2461 domain-containing protein [Deltaproteobacteria bacterium]|nr:DUF2461 domain-containing protein [Deltaproteobacteria bacterium]
MPAHFSERTFGFLRQLAVNNDREWFADHKNAYEEAVKGPMLRFIADFAPELRRISAHFVADPRPVGGSLFRIQRDIRFAKDKQPYKTHAAAQFRHSAGKDVHAPGFYLHLAPGEVFAGAGIWHPDSTTLAAIRSAIVARSAAWKRSVERPPFAEQCRLSGESLQRPPRGFDPDHPLVEDLKRKDFIAVVDLSEAQATSGDFLARFVESCRATLPLVRFLCRALELPC